MKRFNLFRALMLVVIILCLTVPCVSAANAVPDAETETITHWRVPYVSVIDTGFVTKELSEDQQNRIAQNINIQLLSEEPPLVGAVCFDVSDDHLIALGYSKFSTVYICVYALDGTFQYGYSAYYSGEYAIEWVGENLLIYTVRGDLSIEVTPTGEVVECRGIVDCDANRYYWYDIESNGRIVGDTLYRLENDMGFFLNAFAVDYSQVIATNKNGEKTILIDHNADQLQKYVLIFSAIVLFAGGIITYFTVQIVKAIKIVDGKNGKATPTRKE